MEQELEFERRQKDIVSPVRLSPSGGRHVEIAFDEPEISSNGGALVMREVIESSGLLQRLAVEISDNRDPSRIKHQTVDLLTQRVTQIVLGYEDANDCDQLRHDSAVRASVGKLDEGDLLASQPTMTRLENRVGLRDLVRLFYAMIDDFLDSYGKPPEALVLDLDPTAHVLYGQQELGLFNAHYDGYCIMPFHLYEGTSGKLIATVIRPGTVPKQPEIIALLKRVVRRIRSRFPDAQLIFRADSHHCRPEVLEWLESANVNYVVGLATNAVVRREVRPLVEQVRLLERDGMKCVRRFHSFSYSARSWRRRRRVVARVEATSSGTDSRFIVTDLCHVGAKYLYETVYCGRARAELMIKEHKVFLRSDRTSCRTAFANQFRLMMHSAAYVLLHRLRETALAGTAFASANFQTIRLRLLKVAARVQIGRTFTRFHFPANLPEEVKKVYLRIALFGAVAVDT